MQYINDMLTAALETVLEDKKKELFHNVKVNIEYEELEGIMKDKTFYIVSCIIKIIREDTDDLTAFRKIVRLLEENNLSCGDRHKSCNTIKNK